MPPSPAVFFRLARRVSQIRSAYRLLLGTLLGAIAWAAAPAGLDAISRWVAAWDTLRRRFVGVGGRRRFYGRRDQHSAGGLEHQCVG